MIASWKQDHEFLPAISTDGIVWPHVRCHSFSRFAKDGISHGMPVGVIDAFEMIEIGDQNTKRSPLPARSPDFLVQRLQNSPAVPDARQCIVRRLEAHGLPRLYQVVL